MPRITDSLRKLLVKLTGSDEVPAGSSTSDIIEQVADGFPPPHLYEHNVEFTFKKTAAGTIHRANVLFKTFTNTETAFESYDDIKNIVKNFAPHKTMPATGSVTEKSGDVYTYYSVYGVSYSNFGYSCTIDTPNIGYVVYFNDIESISDIVRQIY